MERVRLAHPADFEGFRTAARSLVSRGVPPAAVLWEIAGAEGLPLAEPSPGPHAPLRVPRAFPLLAERVVCHRSSERFALLHEALARLQANPRLLDSRQDPLVDRLEAMAKSVARDVHKMRAFVRFREVEDCDGPHFIAWFEPEHHIVRHNAGFFLRRFASQRWTILTPDESVHWNGETLHHLPGATRAEAPAQDPLEASWQAYYAAIFNPARLKVKAMAAEMPRKYWHNLPEAALIPSLVAGAAERTRAMIAGGEPTTLARLRAEAATCTRCPLHAPATQTVFGEGPPDARLMIVGEQPGDQEDLAGRPFVGPAGQLLDRALAEAGVDRGKAYVTNAVKHFKFEPRGKRRLHQSPTPYEIETCRWWLARERDLVKPRLVLMLGASAARALLDRPVTVGRERGKPLTLPDGAPAFLTVHPSYLLRIENPAAAQAEYARFVADLRAAQALAEAP